MSDKTSNMSLPRRYWYLVRKERSSFQNFVLTDGIFVLLSIIPLVVGIITYLSSNTVIFVSEGTSTYHDQLLTNIVIYGKLSLLIIISYVLTLRFSKGQENGIYGYWLALGVERERFYLYLIGSLSLFSSLGMFGGVLLLNLFLAISLSTSELIMLFFISLISQIFMVTLVLVLDELIEWPEVTLITAILPYLFVFLFVSPEVVPGTIFFSEIAIIADTSMIGSIIQIISSIVLGYIAFRVHQNKDVELGG